MLTQIINGRILTPEGWLDGGSVLIDGNQIVNVVNTDLPIEGAQPYPGTLAAGCPFAGQCDRSTPQCREAADLPLRSWQGGMVRCLNPRREE